MATIFAWTGALRKRGEMDGLNELVEFADKLEKASKRTIEEGIMTGDLANLSELPEKKVVNTKEFLKEIGKRLAKEIEQG
jgi:isocitrate dehydrogenase